MHNVHNTNIMRLLYVTYTAIHVHTELERLQPWRPMRRPSTSRALRAAIVFVVVVVVVVALVVVVVTVVVVGGVVVAVDVV